MPLKWIPRSKPGASKSRPRWAAHTRIGNVWEYPPPRGEVKNTEITGQLFRTRFDLCSWLVVYTSLLYFIHRVQGTSPTFYMFVVYL